MVCSCVEGVDEVSVLSPELLLPDSTVKIKRSTCADVRKNLLKLRDEMKLCDNFNLKVLCNVMSELACVRALFLEYC